MDEQQEQPQETRPEPETPAGGTGVATGGRALLVYASRHGSTREVADAVAEELRAAFAEVDVREARSAPPPAGYDAVVVGGPMIMGWHKDARKYLKRHKDQLSDVPFALFVTAASLTEDGVDAVQGMPIAKDPWLVKKPRNAEKLQPQGALRPAAALRRRHPQGLRPGAAAHRGRLRRVARPDDDEPPREGVRARRHRRDAGRRPPLRLHPRVGGRPGRRARAERTSGGQPAAPGAVELTCGPRARTAAARGPRPPTRPSSTTPPGRSRCGRRWSRRPAARGRSRR